MARVLRKRLNLGKVPPFLEIPNLIEIQKGSYENFLQKDVPLDKREESGLQAAFLSVFPILDYNETASIEFLGYMIGEQKFSIRDCLQKGITYAAPLKIRVKLNLWEFESKEDKRLRESREEDVYIGEVPLMSDTGTFIINGTERVVVSQLHRSPGVFSAMTRVKHTSVEGFFILQG